MKPVFIKLTYPGAGYRFPRGNEKTFLLNVEHIIRLVDYIHENFAVCKIVTTKEEIEVAESSKEIVNAIEEAYAGRTTGRRAGRHLV